MRLGRVGHGSEYTYNMETNVLVAVACSLVCGLVVTSALRVKGGGGVALWWAGQWAG